jgi:predicted regulator of Ras-like GTPase activity (Roadblock/LC7/MglB family)
MPEEIFTTERDANLDLIAALEMYSGLFGSGETTIEKIEEGERDSAIVTLSNGDIFEIRIRRVTK